MNLKRSTTLMAITIMTLSLISMTSVQQDVFAQGLGMSITTTTDQGSDTITVTGMGLSDDTVVTFVVKSPNGNVVNLAQVSPDDDGGFTSVITTGGPLWKQDGIYTVTAQQFPNTLYTAITEVDIQDGVIVPEFGTIAAMILAVAIISIIAISAKSRLSIIPRY